MNAAHRTLAALLVAAALTACGAGEQDLAQEAPAENNALKDMTGTMDKARAVEDATLDHKEGLDRAMEAAQ